MKKVSADPDSLGKKVYDDPEAVSGTVHSREMAGRITQITFRIGGDFVRFRSRSGNQSKQVRHLQ